MNSPPPATKYPSQSREAYGLGERGFTVDEHDRWGNGRLELAMAALDVAGDDLVELDQLETRAMNAMRAFGRLHGIRKDVIPFIPDRNRTEA